ncbi:retrovirus-related pol polyprotein from transposon TNT 1-94 [Tanacetum coccineum]|uniref:Retrovirus-related pol polyprotein from transposon TNT 1-94 n=1 Tax=Tanacetum coccineum TaxID=301880 RepID=A0ABQ5D4P9_9ASTR
MFHDTLQLPMETLYNPFIAPVNIEIIESFMKSVGYQGVVDKVSTFFTKNLAQPWQTMFKVFNRGLTTRTSRHDQTKINIFQLFHVVVNHTNVDYDALIWWDFMNNVFQKKDVIQYPRFTKLIIADFMKKFPDISLRLEEDYHSIKDDIPLVSVYTTENVQVRGMLIPNAFLTEDIRDTDDYKEYEIVFVNVAVPMNQPQRVVSTQGTHRSTPRAHRTPTITAASPQGKKRKQREKDVKSYTDKFAASIIHDDVDDSRNKIEPRSHKEHPKLVDDDDDDNEEEKTDEKKGDEMGNKNIAQELTNIVSLLTATTSNDLHKTRCISSKYSHLLGALRMMCMLQGYKIKDMERKCITTDKFWKVHGKVNQILCKTLKSEQVQNYQNALYRIKLGVASISYPSLPLMMDIGSRGLPCSTDSLAAETPFVRDAVAPVDAENWISHMEKIFDVMDCNDAFKTRLAVYKFEGDALAWWKAYKQAKGGDVWVLTLTWAAFNRACSFFSVFPRAEQEQLEEGVPFIRPWANSSGENFRWGLISQSSTMFMCLQFRMLAQVADGCTSTWKILRDRDDYDRFRTFNKRRPSSGDRYHPYSQQGSHRSHAYTLVRQQRNFGAGRDQRNRGSQQSRVPSKGYTHPVCNTCGSSTPKESVSCMLVLASNVGRLVIFSGTEEEIFLYSLDDKRRSVNALPLDMCELNSKIWRIVFEFRTYFRRKLPGIHPIREELLERGFIPPECNRHGVAPFCLSRRRRQMRIMGHQLFQQKGITMDQAKVVAILKIGLRGPTSVTSTEFSCDSRSDSSGRMTEKFGQLFRILISRTEFRVEMHDGYFMAGFDKDVSRSQETPLVEWYETRCGYVCVKVFNMTAGNWDDYICLVEFAYNNSWHASIKCAPFEMLYGRKCRAPICWDQVGERILEGPEMIEVTNEKVAVAREKLKDAQTRQKVTQQASQSIRSSSRVEQVFLKVSPYSWSLRYLLSYLHVHNVFNVSLTQKVTSIHPSSVRLYPFDQIREDLSYTEEPESILDRQDRESLTLSFHVYHVYFLLPHDVFSRFPHDTHDLSAALYLLSRIHTLSVSGVIYIPFTERYAQPVFLLFLYGGDSLKIEYTALELITEFHNVDSVLPISLTVQNGGLR